VFFDSLAGKAFLARSIKLCLVENQWSSGVMVAGFESCLVWNRITNVEFSTNLTYQLPLERSGLYSSIGIRYFRFTTRYNLVCLRFIFLYYLESTKSLKIFQFPLCYHPFCIAIVFRFALLSLCSWLSLVAGFDCVRYRSSTAPLLFFTSTAIPSTIPK